MQIRPKFLPRLVRQVMGDRMHRAHQELLVRAEIPSLAERRTRAKLCHLYKIIHGLTDCQSAPVQVKSPAYDTRQVSNLTLENIRANTSQFLYSFFPHSISLWNSQPTNIQTTIVSCPDPPFGGCGEREKEGLGNNPGWKCPGGMLWLRNN